mgnify:CR=1 FL=1
MVAAFLWVSDEHSMNKPLALTAALSGFVCVALGAFGAHALKQTVPAELLGTWQTATSYHFYHTLALLAAALSPGLMARPRARRACWLFIAGTILFSGSLYALVLTGQHWLGMVTPLGGTLLLIGWLVLFIALLFEPKP